MWVAGMASVSFRFWDDCVNLLDLEAMWMDPNVAAEWITVGETKGSKVHLSRNPDGHPYLTQAEMKVCRHMCLINKLSTYIYLYYCIITRQHTYMYSNWVWHLSGSWGLMYESYINIHYMIVVAFSVLISCGCKLSSP